MREAMFDGFRFYSLDNKAVKSLQKSADGILSVSSETGEIKKISISDNSLTISILSPERLDCMGCFPKFYKGENSSLFTRKQFMDCLSLLSAKTRINLNNTNLTRIEFGVNISTRKPADCIVDAAMFFKNKTTSKENRVSHKLKSWIFCGQRDKNGGKPNPYYSVKLYGKDEHLLRFEIVRQSQYKKIGNARLKTLSDTSRLDTYVECLRFLYNSVNDFIFVPELPKSL